MMKKRFLLALFVFTAHLAGAQDWHPVQGKIMSSWASEVGPEKPLPEYPRPQMVRGSWQNLNGLWEYTLLPKTENNIPSSFTGKILVPFAIESALSGVGRRVGKDSVLWYRNEIKLSAKLRQQNVLLHFGAVDWKADVYVNGQQVGTHQGGYDPFSFDITNYLKNGSRQEIMVKVWDPTDEGPQPRGKQINNPHGIWYTPVTGIWQTVWIESVPETYIVSTRQTPDIDAETLTISAEAENMKANDRLRITAYDGDRKVDEKMVKEGEKVTLEIADPKLWSPDDPFLYDLKVAIVRNGKVVDEVDSYFAMRKISMAPDENGIQRMLLNNEFVFQYGTLDQGWWPAGLYTAPTDDALKFDIEKTKEMGFNMIRKHVKVEPARWYYYTDKLGMLVWQDMPNGDDGSRWNRMPGVDGIAREMDRTAASENIYRTEWEQIMKDFHNFPSIVVWVPFNEAWGQFKTVEIANWTMEMDPSRLVNTASGGNFHPVGHIIDIHHYPIPAMPRADLFGKDRILVLGEFGGLGLPVEGHTWQDKNNWGYRTFTSVDELFDRYKTYINDLKPLIKKGLSAAIYTQITDVEIETNGLMTYDREVIKIPAKELKAVHESLYEN